MEKNNILYFLSYICLLTQDRMYVMDSYTFTQNMYDLAINQITEDTLKNVYFGINKKDVADQLNEIVEIFYTKAGPCNDTGCLFNEDKIKINKLFFEAHCKIKEVYLMHIQKNSEDMIKEIFFQLTTNIKDYEVSNQGSECDFNPIRKSFAAHYTKWRKDSFYFDNSQKAIKITSLY